MTLGEISVASFVSGRDLARSAAPAKSVTHRPEIDGLRALAVVPVVLVHAGLPWLPGGYIGVDIFFVISGFLIANILLGDLAHHRFSLIGFYDRRARRILPALFVVLAFSLPCGWLLMLPEDFRHFAQSLIAVVLFLPNMFFAHESGYFDASSVYKPLLHTWSLGVEEQFYVFFPILLFGLYKLNHRRDRLLAALGLASMVSLICAEVGWRHNAAVNFFLLPGRAWELLAGCMLAVAKLDRIAAGGRHPRVFQGLSLLGLAVILASYVVFSAATPSPSLFVVAPVVGAVLILACATPSTVCYALLSNRLMIGVGLISYSLYLWHQPVFAFARMIFVGGVSPFGYVGLIVLTVALAYLTWRFVETPFRDRTRIDRKTVFVGALAVMVLFLAAGGSVQLTRGAPGRFHGPIQKVAAGEADISPFRDTCGNRLLKRFEGFCVFGDRAAPIVAVIGDSHGKELFWRATTELAGRSYALQPFLWNGCAPFAGVTSTEPDRMCGPFHRRMRDYILANPRVTTVVIAANWPAYFNCPQRRSCATTPGRLDLSSHPDAAERVGLIAQAMAREIDAYRAAGKTVVLIYPVPQMPWDVPRFMFARLRASLGVADVGVARGAHEARVRRSRNFLDGEAAKDGVWGLDPGAILCSTGRAGFCKAQEHGAPLYFNFGHINGRGADLVAPKLLDLLDRVSAGPSVRRSRVAANRLLTPAAAFRPPKAS